MHPSEGTAPVAWQDGFARLGPAFLTHLQPTPLPTPQWVARNDALATQMGLPNEWFASDAALQALTGNDVLPGSQPYASVYSGHQFGHWAGQLGDGRAITLGETTSGWELQLKGAGRTPYSRGGDGRAVLRSSIREYLCSEAMHALGIPTTRALALTASPGTVYRETAETAAVVTRAAPCLVRFGHFEHFAARDQLRELRALADYVLARYYPACVDGWRDDAGKLRGNAYAALLHAVGQRTAALLAQWQAVGFCHGVMNTDNMSILGLTIDYGPFQFLDGFHPGHICNHSDTHGRYAFERQPQVAYWNLFCLGQALLPLIEDEATTVQALEAYRPAFSQAFTARICDKLGIPGAAVAAHSAAAQSVIGGVLQALAAEQVDYPIFWQRLSQAAHDGDFAPVRALWLDPSAWDAWLLTYQELQVQVGIGLDAHLMQNTNPRYVLRNHVGELAIRAAQAGDFSVVQSLQTVLTQPFDAHPDHSDWAGFPPDWASTIEISCSS